MHRPRQIEISGNYIIMCSCEWSSPTDRNRGRAWSEFYDHKHEATTGQNRYTAERALSERWES